MARPTRTARLTAAAALTVLAVSACSSGGETRFALVSGSMPPLSGQTVTGGVLTPADYANKVVVVNFWASWCAPCRREQPGLERLWREFRRSGVAFVGVNYRDSPREARRYLREFEVTYPSVADTTGSIGSAFGVPYLPATIIVDDEAEMRFRLVGEQEAQTVRQLVETLLSD